MKLNRNISCNYINEHNLIMEKNYLFNEETTLTKEIINNNISDLNIIDLIGKKKIFSILLKKELKEINIIPKKYNNLESLVVDAQKLINKYHWKAGGFYVNSYIWNCEKSYINNNYVFINSIYEKNDDHDFTEYMNLLINKLNGLSIDHKFTYDKEKNDEFKKLIDLYIWVN